MPPGTIENERRPQETARFGTLESNLDALQEITLMGTELQMTAQELDLAVVVDHSMETSTQCAATIQF